MIDSNDWNNNTKKEKEIELINFSIGGQQICIVDGARITFMDM